MEEQVLDFEITENIGILLESKVIIYGTASLAERLYPLIQRIGLKVVGCCDGSKKKAGKFFHGLNIECFTDAIERLEMNNVVILICSTFVKEIIRDCQEICDKNLRFITPFGFQIALVLNRNNPVIKAEFRKWYNQQYDMWFEIQRESFTGWIRHSYSDKLIQMMQSDAVLVYQPGKVGSSSIAESLSAVGIKNIHIHYFQPLVNGISSHDSKKYLDKIQQITSQKTHIKIITLVRDPVARDISTVFQSLSDPSRDMYHGLSWKLADGILEILRNGCDGLTDTEINNIYDGFIQDKDFDIKRPWMFSWFDIELREIFGIDIYAYPFDKEKGYSIISKDNIRCMVIKLEKLDICGHALADFLGIKEIPIINENIGSSKPYSFLYEKCKKVLSLPQELADFYYNGKSIRHFYTEEEISLFRDKWEDISNV